MARGEGQRWKVFKGRDLPVFKPFQANLSGTSCLPAFDLNRLYGRYGKKAEEIDGYLNHWNPFHAIP